MARKNDTRSSYARLNTPYVLTPASLTRVLAYVQKHAPRRARDARLLRAAHLRALATWIGVPAPAMRSLSQHLLLAGHIALLEAAGLLSTRGARVVVSPEALSWIFAAPQGQIARLLQALDTAAWHEALARLRLQRMLTIDYAAFLRQTLQRQLDDPARACHHTAPATLQTQPQRWLLAPLSQLPAYRQFDLLQLGHWDIDADRLLLTPLSLATAHHNGYATAYVRDLLQHVTGRELDPEHSSLLAQWMGRSTHHTVSSVMLLQTAQPAQLAQLMAQRHLRRHIVRQIGPRHAILDAQGIAHLRRRLQAQGAPLAGAIEPHTNGERCQDEDAGWQWLGLCLMTALAALIPLPFAPPHRLLQDAAAQMPPQQVAVLEQLCAETMARLRRAINGRDAFFPARRCPSPTLIATIQTAIDREQALELTYQGLGEAEARRRQVHPLRLEQQGQLHYMVAYCLLAEAQRTFRLDRLHECRVL